MARFQRVVTLCLVVVLVWLGLVQRANAGLIPSSSGRMYYVSGYSEAQYRKTSAQAACDWYGQLQLGAGFGYATVEPSAAANPAGSYGSCYIYRSTGAYYTGLGYNSVAAQICPTNSTLDGSGTTCSCDTGYVENSTHTACVSAQQAVCDLAKGITEWFQGTGKPALGSNHCAENGCQAQLGGLVYYTNIVTKITSWEGEGMYDGQTCSYNPDAPDAMSKDDCPNGDRGYINNVMTCIPKSPGNTVTSITPTSSTSSGTTTSSTGTTTTSVSGESGTKETTCTGSSCTTTTTSNKTNADGSTTTEVTTESTTREDYCTRNPGDRVCKSSEGGSFAGSCAAGFSCSGDAVMCATARAAYEQKCALVDGPATPNAEQQAYGSAALGGTGYGLTTTTLTISGANFDSSNALGVGGQCVSDVEVTVWGRAVSLPISTVCPHLATLGTVLVAVAWIMAAVIVGKGVQG